MKEKIKFSRRSFLKMVGGVSLAGMTLGAAACAGPSAADRAAGGDGWMPSQYNVAGSWPVQVKGRIAIDSLNPSITRDDQKCILCGQCIEVCKNVETVYDFYELPLKEEAICVHCGQCTHWCPSGAITEVDDTARLIAAINDPNKIVVVQTAPSVRVGLGDDFGLPVGTNVAGKMVAALRRLGVDIVSDTNWGADMTIMEEAAECVHRLTTPGEPQLMFTSCCPAWVKFAEYYYPEILPNLSTTRSPMGIQGPLIKTYYAGNKGIDPASIFSVAIMPCTAKKFECAREEMNSAAAETGIPGLRDTDAVVTTRELARMMKSRNINLADLPEEEFDDMISAASGAGIIFGNTGGVMEAAVRTAWYNITGEQPPAALWELAPVRGLDGVKEASLDVPGFGEIKVAVCHGLGNARRLIDRVKTGEASYNFVEVMACPGGCISGGGQPRSATPPSDAVRLARIETLYGMDRRAAMRNSHDNPEVVAIYNSFLETPLSEKAHHLLHTTYHSKADRLQALPPAAYPA
ncbi:MAG: [FeFe] hydrogenase, group A [Gracilibacteraceae bacterium]|jgi:NADH-quinone oxidoreductase subunit G|nr:[FeFe] hydrogenase, group A [Gracilibacteraceae bacterium]